MRLLEYPAACTLGQQVQRLSRDSSADTSTALQKAFGSGDCSASKTVFGFNVVAQLLLSRGQKSSLT